MFSSKVMLRLAFLCIILLISTAFSHEKKADNDHPHDHHHEHEHKNHEKTFTDEAKDVASASIHMMIKAALFSAVTFIIKWSVYIGIAGAVIWYFVTHRGAPQGATQATGHGQGHARSD
uniref:Transmembrane protein n=1 Tax=Panagrolaimus superbus TaxID=310955 RepID=A0A914YY44_9BILA